MTDRNRIDVVLRVRRVQELQAAGDLAAARLEAEAAGARLGEARDRYDANRDLDDMRALVPASLADRQVRELHARTIQRARLHVKELLAKIEERQIVLTERTQAVKGLERLDERLAIDEETERRRAETRELDERRLTAPVLS